MSNRADRTMNSYSLLWLSLVVMISLGLSFLLPITPNDYWWYLRIGRDTVAEGLIPTVDTLSSTQFLQPVTYHSWLSAVIFWLAFKAGGIPLTVLLRGLMIGLAYGIVWVTARHASAGPKLTSLIVLFAMLSASSNWMVRPQMFAYPLFALLLLVVWNWDRGRDRSLWLLPVISILWVNLHGSFVLLFILAGAALIFGVGNRKKLLFALAAALLAATLNPRGLAVWQYIVVSITVPSSQLFSVEWGPPVNDNWHNNIFFLWLLIFPLLAAFSNRKLSRLEWAWYVGFGMLALWGLRYVVWFLFVMAVLTARLVSEWGNQWLDRPVPKINPILNTVLAIIFVILPLAVLPGLRERWWGDAPPALSANTPVSATNWLEANPHLPGPLWADLDFSSYLTFALDSRRVWIDTRFEVYPVEQWEKYLQIAAAEPNWQTLIDDEGINLLFLSTDRQPGLLESLVNTSGWCEVYRDDIAVISTRIQPVEMCQR